MKVLKNSVILAAVSCGLLSGTVFAISAEKITVKLNLSYDKWVSPKPINNKETLTLKGPSSTLSFPASNAGTQLVASATAQGGFFTDVQPLNATVSIGDSSDTFNIPSALLSSEEFKKPYVAVNVYGPENESKFSYGTCKADMASFTKNCTDCIQSNECTKLGDDYYYRWSFFNN